MLTKLKANRKGWDIVWGPVSVCAQSQLTESAQTRMHGYWLGARRQYLHALTGTISRHLQEQENRRIDEEVES